MSLRHWQKYCLANRQGTIEIQTVRDIISILIRKKPKRPRTKRPKTRLISGMAMHNQCENEKVNVFPKASHRVNSYCEVAGTLGRHVRACQRKYCLANRQGTIGIQTI